jgi:hypothetical protein
MRHVLVSSGKTEWGEDLRAAAPADAVVLSVSGIDETLEKIARSARVDYVVTDDPAVAEAIREEIPGSLPVLLAAQVSAAMVWQRIEAISAGAPL